MKYIISSYCRILNGRMELNGNSLFQATEDMSHEEFVKQGYKFLNPAYPKFYKMDTLCKLGFLASELVLKDSRLTERYPGERVALIVNNSSSSMDMDREHQSTISDKSNYFPSPAVFVYTLPNIVLGEIAIRNNIKGENTLFIFERFNAEFMHEYVTNLLDRDSTDACLAGYLDYQGDQYHAFMYVVERTEGSTGIEHEPLNLKQLF